MKKNIGFVPMDSSLAAWLLEKLTKEPPVSDSTEELRCVSVSWRSTPKVDGSSQRAGRSV